MSDYKSMTKILNEVYDGTALNTQEYGSATAVLNAVYNEGDNALSVNVEGFSGGGVTYDDDLYYTDEDILYTPNLVITAGETSSFQLLDTVTGLPYNLYIVNGVLTIAAV
jgi:hypothetical protein